MGIRKKGLGKGKRINGKELIKLHKRKKVKIRKRERIK
jgi:hypothetical protein